MEVVQANIPGLNGSSWLHCVRITSFKILPSLSSGFQNLQQPWGGPQQVWPISTCKSQSTSLIFFGEHKYKMPHAHVCYKIGTRNIQDGKPPNFLFKA
jgi:hypothetical protein